MGSKYSSKLNQVSDARTRSMEISLKPRLGSESASQVMGDKSRSTDLEGGSQTSQSPVELLHKNYLLAIGILIFPGSIVPTWVQCAQLLIIQL